MSYRRRLPRSSEDLTPHNSCSYLFLTFCLKVLANVKYNKSKCGDDWLEP